MRRSLTVWVSLVQQLCDTNKFSQDIRKHLVNPLPGDCRMTVRFFIPLTIESLLESSIGYPRHLQFWYAPQLGALRLPLLHTQALSMYAFHLLSPCIYPILSTLKLPRRDRSL